VPNRNVKCKKKEHVTIKSIHHGIQNITAKQTLYCPTNAHNVKNVELLKHFKMKGLLQHVSVYRETIIREPQPVLS
jgi:hypothetical protein